MIIVDRLVRNYRYLYTESGQIQNSNYELHYFPANEDIWVSIINDDGSIAAELSCQDSHPDRDHCAYSDSNNSIEVVSDYEGMRVIVGYTRIGYAWIRNSGEFEYIEVVDADKCIDSETEIIINFEDLINLFEFCSDEATKWG